MLNRLPRLIPAHVLLGLLRCLLAHARQPRVLLRLCLRLLCLLLFFIGFFLYYRHLSAPPL